MKNKFYVILILLVIVAFSGCTEKPQNLTAAKKAVQEYYESGKFYEELNEVIEDAIDKFKGVEIKDSSVVIFDVDETVLNNYELAKQMGFGYVYKINKEWNAKAKTPSFPQVKKLYDFLLSKGAHIIFLTGRNFPEYEVTYKNLKNAGFTVFDTLITQISDETKMPAMEFKSMKRTELVKKGYDIIGTVGDQPSDIEGPYHGIQVRIPNYLYGDVY